MKNIVFIDSRVADRKLLLQNMPTDSLIVELNASADGLQQIADTLKNYANLDAVHIVSHGSAGALYLGSSVINNQALASYTSALSVIGNSLTATGDILLYGCNVAEGDAGKLFISELSRTTGADVAASTDSTGGSGNWVLEQQTGNIEANTLTAQNDTATLGMIDGFIIDVEGTEGTDWNLQGTDGPNHIYGYGGNDYMYGNDASDTLEGGSGNDYMEGGADADLLQGDAGNDDLRGDDGDDVLWGGSGNDTLKGGAGTDTYLYASGDGQERIDNYDYGSSNVDSIGLDSMIETNMVKFSRKVGTDDLVIGFTNNSTDAITVNNYFSSSADSQGYSRILLNFGDGTIWDASDISKRVVSMEGTTSSDSMYGTVNPNSMRGLNGNDYLYGYDGNDTLEGGDGSDQLEAGDGDDILRGDAGNDRLYGNSGNDTLNGGDGNDILEGNSGVDTYLFGIGSGQDQVNAYDYNSGDIDIVKLGAGITTSNIRFARALSTDDLLISIDGKTDTLAISNYFSYSAEENGYQRIKLVFSDGTEWSAEDIASSVVNVIGNSSGNSLYGTVNPNLMRGDAGNDYLYGYAGSDTLEGGDGSDQLEGGDDSDVLKGDAGNDRLYGNSGDDTLNGGADNDVLEGNAGADTYLFDSGSGQDQINAYDYNNNDVDTVLFGSGIVKADVKLARALATDDLVVSFAGKTDTLTLKDYFGYYASLNGYSRVDFQFTDGSRWEEQDLRNKVVSMEGSSSSNSLYGTGNPNSLRGNAGNDYLYGYSQNDTLEGGDGNDQLEGGDDNDTLQGDAGNDSLYGNSGNDTLNGGVGNDYLQGDAGVDVYRFSSGSGQDVINAYDYNNSDIDIVQLGSALTAGGISFARAINTDDLVLRFTDWTDTLTIKSYFGYSAETQGYSRISLKFSDGSAWDAEAISKKVINMTGTGSNETMYGTANPDSILGNGGNDYLYGMDGNDTLDGGSGSDYIEGDEGDDVLTGGDGNDRLYGKDGDDVFYGGDGNDQMEGGAGADVYVFGIGSKQDEINAYDYNSSSIDVVQLGAGITTGAIRMSRTSDDLLIRISNNDNDKLTIKNYFSYDAENQGYSRIALKFTDGSSWSDGVFTIVDSNHAPTGNVTISGTPTQGQTLRAVSTLADSDGLGVLQYQWLANNVAINGATGATFALTQAQVGKTISVQTRYTDNLGHDESVLSAATRAVTAVQNPGILFTNTNALTTTEAGGRAAFQVALRAEPRHDVTLTFTLSDKTEGKFLSTGGAISTVTFTASNWNTPQTVTVVGVDDNLNDDNITYNLSTSVRSEDLRYDGMRSGTGLAISNLTITNTDDDQSDEQYGDAGGAAIADLLNGGNGASDLYGLNGRDELHGGNGDDRLYGGNGDDVLYGEADNDELEGDQGNDKLYGGAGNDTLTGGTGRDSLYGGDGNDVLDGSSDRDFMDGGNGADTYYVDNVGDMVSDSGTDTASDTVYISVYLAEGYTLATGIDNATLDALASNAALTGNSGKNILTGNGGDNTLSGGSGNDTLNGGAGKDNLVGGTGNDVLDGGVSADTLSGGAGDDVYVINSGDRISETADAGIDTVQSSISYVLAKNFEKLLLSGNSALKGTGNTADNELTGNAGANELSGDAGNDVLIGGEGKDTLTGGAGRDVFKLEKLIESGVATAGRDVIGDFVRGEDKIGLSALDANTQLAGDQAFTTFILSSKTFTAAGQLQFKNGVLYGNTDNDADAEFSIALTGITTLGMTDVIA